MKTLHVIHVRLKRYEGFLCGCETKGFSTKPWFTSSMASFLGQHQSRSGQASNTKYISDWILRKLSFVVHKCRISWQHLLKVMHRYATLCWSQLLFNICQYPCLSYCPRQAHAFAWTNSKHGSLGKLCSTPFLPSKRSTFCTVVAYMSV